MIIILEPCRRSLVWFLEDIRGDVADALMRLEAGHPLSMPLSRPMPGIGSRVHELRLRDRTGAYRVIYALTGEGNVYVLHAFRKTTQKTSKRDIELAGKRLREIER